MILFQPHREACLGPRFELQGDGAQILIVTDGFNDKTRRLCDGFVCNIGCGGQI